MTRAAWPLLGALSATLVLWASGFVAIRLAVREYPPEALALLRFSVASLTLAAWVLLWPPARVRLPARRDLPGLLLTGVIGISVYHLALNAGEQTVSAGTASLIVNLNPIFTALIAAAVLGERLGGWGWLGVLIGFAGAAILALAESGGFRIEAGAGLVLVAAASQAIYFVLQKPFLTRYRPLEATAYAVWLGTLCLAPFAPSVVRAMPAAAASTTLAAIYLGVFPGAVAYTTWAFVLSRLPAGRATSTLYLVPPLGAGDRVGRAGGEADGAGLAGWRGRAERRGAGQRARRAVACGGYLFRSASGLILRIARRAPAAISSLI
ncbi:MAG: DMT family transporter, partial [Gemmatimonadales bacterium]